MNTRIRKLSEQFRVGESKYFLKKRTGQVALYARYSKQHNTLVGFVVFKLRVADLGRSLDFGPMCLIEVFPKPSSKGFQSFASGEEVEAWTAFQNLVDKQASLG